jgi:hypothetical protein
MRRLIWLPLAGFLLIAGAAIAAAATAPSVTPVAQTNADTASPAPTATATAATGDNTDGKPGDPSFHFGFGPNDGSGPAADLLDEVLSGLVTDGTITQAQSDAITSALEQAITDKQSQAEQERQKLMNEWQQIQGFLSDGVITQDEVNQLPSDSPFRQVFDSIAQDGQISLDQLQQLRMFGPGFGVPGVPGVHVHGFGPGGRWGNGDGNGQDQDPDASPSTSTTSS